MQGSAAKLRRAHTDQRASLRLQIKTAFEYRQYFALTTTLQSVRSHGTQDMH
jgi:hypothetical protein